MIKGFIYPALVPASGDNSNNLINSFQGKITVYLGKRINGDRITGQIEQLFQNGNTNLDPVGEVKEQIYHVNDDKYKVYWKRSFNVGVSTPNYNLYRQPSTGPDPGDQVAVLNENIYSNNDLKLHSQFTIDVTKYIGKNATIKFNDNNPTAQIPAQMQGLALWATFAPFSQNINPAAGGLNSFYKIWSNAYYEYEDA